MDEVKTKKVHTIFGVEVTEPSFADFVEEEPSWPVEED